MNGNPPASLSPEQRCACVSDDGRECYRRRYNLSYDEIEDRDDAKCECVCHFDEDEPEEWI